MKATLPCAKAEGACHAAGRAIGPKPRYPRRISERPGTWEVFTLMGWRDARMASLSQARLVEKFVDALVWVFYPVYLYQQDLSLTGVGWMVGIYGFVSGTAQFFTGRLSDHLGRQKLIVAGMWICGTGVAAHAAGPWHVVVVALRRGNGFR